MRSMKVQCDQQETTVIGVKLQCEQSEDTKQPERNYCSYSANGEEPLCGQREAIAPSVKLQHSGRQQCRQG